ncbi:hypothetical protein T484DRAFT_1980914 [Baffinella frigidus]|nr:hypothetical protein T484DRAFT_1980914 [Cryptophyta sp. CCMP2293]
MKFLGLIGSRASSASWVLFAVAWAFPATLGGKEHARVSRTMALRPGFAVLVPPWAVQGLPRLRGGGGSCAEPRQLQEQTGGAAETDGAAEATQAQKDAIFQEKLDAQQAEIAALREQVQQRMLEIDAWKQTSTEENAEKQTSPEEHTEKGIFGIFAALESGGERLHRKVAVDEGLERESERESIPMVDITQQHQAFLEKEAGLQAEIAVLQEQVQQGKLEIDAWMEANPDAHS